MENIITLVINNTAEYTGWQTMTLSKSLENISASFNISYTQKFDSNQNILVPIKKGDEVKVLIDQKQIINGYIDSLDISYNNTSHKLSIQGRDKTSDIVDSSLLGNVNINQPFSIERLFNKVLTSLNLQDDIEVINNAGTLIYNEDFDSGRGKGAWQIIDRYLQKKSVFATSNNDGNIVIFRDNFGNTNDSLIHKVQNGISNNVLAASSSDDMSKRYNIISVISQSESIVSFGEFSNQGGENFSVTDDTIRNSRKLEILSKTNLTSNECKQLAEFQRNVRFARGTSYTYTVQGYKQRNGDLWLPNYLIHVDDDFFDINDNFLIKSVTYSKDLDKGSITDLVLVDKNSYTLREPVALSKERGLLFQI